jgi:hypothetical protein
MVRFAAARRAFVDHTLARFMNELLAMRRLRSRECAWIRRRRTEANL